MKVGCLIRPGNASPSATNVAVLIVVVVLVVIRFPFPKALSFLNGSL